jgi:predicted type IV restriction endonuclease
MAYAHHGVMERTKTTSQANIDLVALNAEISSIRAYASHHIKARAKSAGRSKGRRERHLNEPQVAMVMVQPILNLMGWGTRDDPDSLWRELALTNGQVDFACLVDNEVRVTIECKNLGVNLREEVVTQAGCYAFARARHSRS